MTKTHKAWRLHAHNDLRLDDVETPTTFKLADFKRAIEAAALMQGLDLTAVVP